jgi:molecular chaperone HtpG
LVSVTRGVEEIAALDDAEKAAVEAASKRHDATLKRFAEVLKEKVKAVRPSARLTESPACLVVEEGGMTLHLKRMLEAAGQKAPAVQPVLEVNVDHPLFARIAATEDEASFAEWATLLFEEALLAEGGTLDDPAGFVKRVNRLLAA